MKIQYMQKCGTIVIRMYLINNMVLLNLAISDLILLPFSTTASQKSGNLYQIAWTFSAVENVCVLSNTRRNFCFVLWSRHHQNMQKYVKTTNRKTFLLIQRNFPSRNSRKKIPLLKTLNRFLSLLFKTKENLFVFSMAVAKFQLRKIRWQNSYIYRQYVCGIMFPKQRTHNLLNFRVLSNLKRHSWLEQEACFNRRFADGWLCSFCLH